MVKSKTRSGKKSNLVTYSIIGVIVVVAILSIAIINPFAITPTEPTEPIEGSLSLTAIDRDTYEPMNVTYARLLGFNYTDLSDSEYYEQVNDINNYEVINEKIDSNGFSLTELNATLVTNFTYLVEVSAEGYWNKSEYIYSANSSIYLMRIPVVVNVNLKFTEYNLTTGLVNGMLDFDMYSLEGSDLVLTDGGIYGQRIEHNLTLLKSIMIIGYNTTNPFSLDMFNTTYSQAEYNVSYDLYNGYLILELGYNLFDESNMAFESTDEFLDSVNGIAIIEVPYGYEESDYADMGNLEVYSEYNLGLLSVVTP